MPTKKLPEQTGNSCAAHCTVIGIAELLDVDYLLSKGFAEMTLWPTIKFKAGESPLTDALAKADNSDPRRIVTESELRWGGSVKASILCDDVEKTTALGFVGPMAPALAALFNMIKGGNLVTTIALQDGIYYNCSYLMLKGAAAKSAVYEGMHNILVTNFKGSTFYYNPNEKVPVWTKDPADWKTLENQNGGTYSYVFTGVCVELKRK